MLDPGHVTPLPRSAGAPRCPVTITLPPGSTATPYAESTPVPPRSFPHSTLPPADGVPTVTTAVSVPTAPRSSTTTNDTVYVPATAYAWLAVAPLAAAPSPNIHVDDVTTP